MLVELANMMSKNELKANHNAAAALRKMRIVGKYDVKERIESKSQHDAAYIAMNLGWQI